MKEGGLGLKILDGESGSFDIEAGNGMSKEPLKGEVSLVKNGASAVPPPVQCPEPCRSTCQLLKRHPLLLVPPAVLFALVVALCVFGLTYSIDAKVETQQRLAQHVARDTADALVLQLNVISGAALTLAAFVKRDPDWNRLEREFLPVAKEVFRQAKESSTYDLAELQYVPFGTIRASYSETNPRNVSTDLFLPENLERTGVFDTVELGSMTINGPLALTVGGRQALIARYPVFIQNVSRDESWNHPDGMTAPTGCEERCYDPETRTKFWGFTAGFFYADSLLFGTDPRLLSLVDDGYSYSLSKISHATGREVIVEHDFREDKVTASVDLRVPGANWRLSVYTTEIRDTYSMRDGLIAMIVIVAFILSCLLLLLLVSHRKAAQLLEEQLVTNRVLEQTNNRLLETKRVLEAEKQQREALLGRQYDLIACFEQRGNKYMQGGGKGSDISSSFSSSMAEKQQATLGRIAAVRRAIDEDRGQAPHPNDDIRLFELLGEGTFGKVHRGLWRQTVVAIKIILLPANMSGAEKREKMVVWEAAISSSLTHPNIVQTYTYSIKPMKESRDPGTSKEKELGSAVVFLEESRIHQGSLLSKSSDGTDHSSGGGAIHSFEVQLVLEYCDKGCLRDALDRGVFMGPSGLNYPAILDCAEDIARAMLHLHCNNVLHMDLKARNVMLASSGTEGRGVNCKIADFGLAVRIGLTETHLSGCFQGTMTHMAPEVLLEGRVSKAADVYAFGITMWELFTAGQPYKGVPKALLGHRVVKEHRRPPLPLVIPDGFRELMVKCWSPKPEQRPTFAEVLECLRQLRSQELHPTPPLSVVSPSDASPGSTHRPPARRPTLEKLLEEARIAEEEEGEEEGGDAVEGSRQGKEGKAGEPGDEQTGAQGLKSGRGMDGKEPRRQSWLELMAGVGLGSGQGSNGGQVQLLEQQRPSKEGRAEVARQSGQRSFDKTQGGKRAKEGMLERSHGQDVGLELLEEELRRVEGGAAGWRGQETVGEGRQEAVGEGVPAGSSSNSGPNGQRSASHAGTASGGEEGEDGAPPRRRKSYSGPQRSTSFGVRRSVERAVKDSSETHQSDPGLVRPLIKPSPSPSPFSRSPGNSRHMRFSQSSRSSRSKGSHSCVLVIGEDDEHMYPENNHHSSTGNAEGGMQGFGNTRVEVTGVRSKAALGYMLEPIGEERYEGPCSADPKRSSLQV